MSESVQETPTVELTLTVAHLPRFDPSHGTPDPMTRRLISVRIDGRAARFEQTDYGHAGRFNGWEARGIDAALQARTAGLLALCDAVTALIA